MISVHLHCFRLSTSLCADQKHYKRVHFNGRKQHPNQNVSPLQICVNPRHTFQYFSDSVGKTPCVGCFHGRQQQDYSTGLYLRMHIKQWDPADVQSDCCRTFSRQGRVCHCTPKALDRGVVPDAVGKLCTCPAQCLGFVWSWQCPWLVFS